MLTTTIRAITHALPATVLTYEELAERLGEKEVSSIFRMSGIRNRRVVAPGQCASDLAVSAANRLFEHTGIGRSEIDLLLFASQTPDYRMPATACKLQGDLKLAESCSAFDINQACAAYIFSLQIAHSMLVAGTARRALVLNADALSPLIHPRDRGLVTLHGDAAVATLLEPCDSDTGGIEFFEVGTAGANYDKIIVPVGGARFPAGPDTSNEDTDENGCVRTREHLYMDGPAVFHFVLYKVSDFLKGLFRRRGLTADDFDMILFHQANKTMVDMLYKALGIPREKRFYYLEHNGNSGGASLPSLLSQAWREGVIKPGSRTLMCAFGGGLSWGATAIRWPQESQAAVPGEVDVQAVAS